MESSIPVTLKPYFLNHPQNLYILKEYDVLLELSKFMLKQGIHLQNVVNDISGVEKEKAKAGGSQRKYLDKVMPLLEGNSWDPL